MSEDETRREVVELRALHAALAEAQGEYPTIAKDKTANIQTKDGGRYSYTYADLGAILAAIRPVLSKHGLSITQPLDITENGQLVLRSELRHAEGAMIESVWPIPAANTPQQLGSALTYLRRYALIALLGVAPDDDDDGAEASQPESQPSATSAGGVSGGFTRTAPSYGPESDAPTDVTPAAKVVQEVTALFGTLRGLERRLGLEPEQLTDWSAWTRGKLGLAEGEFGTDADYRKALVLLSEERVRLESELEDRERIGWPGEEGEEG